MNHVEEQRLQKLLDLATEKASDAGRQRAEKQAELAQARTQFFEKLALGYGAALAAVVSFLGAKHQEFHPSWLFRMTLLAMAVTMFLAVARNWVYPKYVSSVFAVFNLRAQMERELARAEFFKSVPVLSLQTGKPAGTDSWMKNHNETQVVFRNKIEKFDRDEKRAWKTVRVLEHTCLVSACFAALCLTTLALINF